VFTGGRDSMKSWAIAFILIILSYYNDDLLICCAKGTMVSISDSVKKLLEDLIAYLDIQDAFVIQDKTITCKHTRSTFIFKGLQHPDRLKSTEGIDYLWLEEANVDTDDETFDVVMPTIRKEGSKVFMSFNPKLKEEAVYRRYILTDDPYTYKCHTTYKDNPFLSSRSRHTIEDMRRKDLKKYKHIYEGECRTEIEGALWKDSYFNYGNDDNPVFEKIVVSVDPAGGDETEKGDAAGIAVVGKYAGIDRWCIIEDATGNMSPNSWAKKCVALYNKYEANKIVYETNYGKFIVRDLIRSVDKRVPLEGVNSLKGKLTRAEPVAVLYEQGKVDHAEMFVDLEYEMTSFNGTGKSPNRMDAAVQGILHLMNGIQVGVPAVHLST